MVLAARARATRFGRVFETLAVPLLLVDDDRQYVHGNLAASLTVRLSRAELRARRVGDLSASRFHEGLERSWTRMRTTGSAGGRTELGSQCEPALQIRYYGVAEVLPNRNLVAFAPAAWPEEELLPALPQTAGGSPARLTRRELEILQMAADGHHAQMIADELAVSVTTIRTHFANIYAKLEVGDRAAAVAAALRHGLIS